MYQPVFASYWPSIIIYQPPLSYTDQVPPCTNQCQNKKCRLSFVDLRWVQLYDSLVFFRSSLPYHIQNVPWVSGVFWSTAKICCKMQSTVKIHFDTKEPISQSTGSFFRSTQSLKWNWLHGIVRTSRFLVVDNVVLHSARKLNWNCWKHAQHNLLLERQSTRLLPGWREWGRLPSWGF